MPVDQEHFPERAEGPPETGVGAYLPRIVVVLDEARKLEVGREVNHGPQPPDLLVEIPHLEMAAVQGHGEIEYHQF